MENREPGTENGERANCRAFHLPVLNSRFSIFRLFSCLVPTLPGQGRRCTSAMTYPPDATPPGPSLESRGDLPASRLLSKEAVRGRLRRLRIIALGEQDT